MNDSIKNLIQHIFHKFGYEIHSKIPSDFNKDEIEIINFVQSYTMTSPERIYSLIESVKYICNNNILGDIVECGVWKGGSIMAMAKTLLKIGRSDKDLYLFDTFEGMTKPSKFDVTYAKTSAEDTFKIKKINDSSSNWCLASLDEVKKNIHSVGYNKEKIHFIKGKVEETIPLSAPFTISLLRLDTDWYESTKHELTHLFPRLSKGGVIIIDDYGYWQGARKAVDEYIQQNKIQILLNRIDSTARIGIKI